MYQVEALKKIMGQKSIFTKYCRNRWLNWNRAKLTFDMLLESDHNFGMYI